MCRTIQFVNFFLWKLYFCSSSYTGNFFNPPPLLTVHRPFRRVLAKWFCAVRSCCDFKRHDDFD